MADESGLFAAETTVLGVGNVILRDEGFGVRVAENIRVKSPVLPVHPKLRNTFPNIDQAEKT